jgi:hypothetical protein
MTVLLNYVRMVKNNKHFSYVYFYSNGLPRCATHTFIFVFNQTKDND